MTLAERLEIAARGAAVGPVEACGLLRCSGRDARSFLHRMSTQELARRSPGEGAYAAFLDARGHLVADALVRVGEGELLLLTAPEAEAPLRAHLQRFVMRDQVILEEQGAGWRCLPVLGEEGARRARAGPGPGVPVDDGRRGAPAVDLLLPAGEAAAVRAEWLAAGALDLAGAELEALRVQAGLPRFGADLAAGRLAIEAPLAGAAIRFDKGCYLGQEVVLRGTFRGQVQRGLVQLALPPGAGPGAPLSAAGQEVGAITSAAETPAGRLGLGYLRRAFWPAGTRLATAGGEATVVRPLLVERD